MTHPDPGKAAGGRSGRQDAREPGATRPGPGSARQAATPAPGITQPGTKAPGSGSDHQHAGFGWSVFSYMIGGMILYGGIGWLVGRWTDLPVLFPVGMIVGLGLAIALIIFRVTRS